MPVAFLEESDRLTGFRRLLLRGNFVKSSRRCRRLKYDKERNIGGKGFWEFDMVET